MDGSLTKFIDKIGGEYSGKLSRDYEVSRLLKSKQGTEKIQVFNVDDISQISSGNVVDSKRKILESLSVNTLEDAYNKLLDSFSREGKMVKVGEPKLKEGNLKDLPFVKFYEKDGGYYLTSSLIIACYKNICNASIHRIMMLNDKEAAVRIVPRHLYYLYKEALKNNEILPVSVIIGIHPAIILAASSSPQLGYFELNAAANILGNLEIYNSPIHKNPIPLGAAAIIEGFITEKQVDEGPFVEAMGGYDKIRKQPVLKAEKVYLNSDETTHVILPGGYEHAMLMGFPREASIYNAVSKVVPKVHGVHLTLNSGGWLHAIISIDKNHDGDSKNAILAAFSAHPSLKHVIVVDPDVNIYDINDVEWAIATRFQADRDLIIINNARGSTLDPSAKDGLTSKIGIDATKPLNAGFEYERAKIP
ncbi:UbiD family decarboxylase [Caldisphaera sp.]|uniref:UbiD family decarboxylase n=1 Tax=Caldisphaera sp. TaxID=2060322 RepID=UPI0025BA3050|nr:UbiD family decarboxylase [Caldisphaera sp.]